MCSANMKGGDFKLKEFVGICHCCKKEIYCLNGFLNGIVKDDGMLICFSCEEEEKKEK